MKEIEKEIEDHYQDHKQHFTYDEKCSTCYSNVKEFDSDEYEEENSMFGVDLELVHNSYN